jgi:hypothetical protein
MLWATEARPAEVGMRANIQKFGQFRNRLLTLEFIRHKFGRYRWKSAEIRGRGLALFFGGAVQFMRELCTAAKCREIGA